MFSKLILLGSAAAMLAASASLANAAVTKLTASKGVTRLIIQTDNVGRTFESPIRTVTTATFAIPSTQTGILVATFTGESQCRARDWCSISITCDEGQLLDPKAADDFAFDSPGGALFASYSATFHSKPLTGGSHVCKVLSFPVGGGAHRLDDWVFTVEFWQQ